ncbi:MAG TPA: hypothetical protein VKR06_00940 [Ktedonosporobacter sp.]|nr:hypothetical protein [Ktedonosporobacter sp.]
MNILHLFLIFMDSNYEPYPLYAENEDNAIHIARTWIESTSPRRRKYAIIPCPGGYVAIGSHAFENFTLPGTLYLTEKEKYYAAALS